MKAHVLLVVSLCLLSSCGPWPRPPTDQELINRFNANRATFEALVAMICKDGYKVVSMDPEWSKPAALSANVKQRYYELFKAIGVKEAQSYDGCRVQLSVWSVGIGGDGDYKQYQYRPSNNEREVSSLDHLPLSSNKVEFYYRKLANDWYLEYAHWP